MKDHKKLLLETAAYVLGNEDRAKRWLKTPKKALGDESPLDHARTKDGLQEVLDLLGRLQHGVFG